MVMATICIPTFRRAVLFARCLESVFSAFDASAFRFKLVISDNCNGRDYDWVWKKFSAQFEKYEVVILHSAIVLDAFDNWKRALSHVAGSHFLLLSDDDMIVDLRFPFGNYKGVTLFFANNILFPCEVVQKKHSILGYLPISIFVFNLCVGRFRPTLCSIFFNSACVEDFLKLHRPFGRNGDHADGYLILASLKYSSKAFISNKIISNYSLEGQGYTSNIDLRKHLGMTKVNFVLNCFQGLGSVWGAISVVWATNGALIKSARILFPRLWS